jgi:hypothetical protein
VGSLSSGHSAIFQAAERLRIAEEAAVFVLL